MSIFSNFYKKREYFFTIFLILIAIGGVLLILFLTSRMGAGLSPDSVAYIAAARNLLNGNGVIVLYNSDGTVPLNLWLSADHNEIKNVVLWPPLYPVILALTGIFGLDIVVGAKWLNAILFGLNIFMIGFVIKKITKSIAFSILSAIFFVFSKELIFVHYMAWSEPLFILLSFTGLFMLLNYLLDKKLIFLYLSAIIIGLAALCRYAGIILIITGVLGIIIFNNEKIRKRILQSLIFISISCLPILIWFIRLISIGNSSSGRRLFFNPIKIDEINMLMDNVTKWLLPGRFSLNLRIVLMSIFIVLVFTCFIVIYKKNKNISNDFGQEQIYLVSLLFFIFICIYLFFIFLTRLISDFDFYSSRVLSPIYIAFIFIIIFFLKTILNITNNRKIILVFTYFIFFIFISFNLTYFFYGHHNKTARTLLYKGNGYARSDWVNSQTIKEIKGFPEDTLIYTNEPNAIYILADRTASMVPAKLNYYAPASGINENYPIQIKDMEMELKEKNGILVLFKIGMGFLPKDYEIVNELQLHLLEPYSDGAIYKVY